MRLLCVIDSLGSGGAQRQLVSLVLGLAERGHHPAVCVYYWNDFFADALRSAGVEVRLLRKGSRFSIAPVFALMRMLREEPFDAVIAYLPTPSIYAELACLLPGAPPVVVSERSTFEYDPPTLMMRARTHMHRLADVVVANSHHHRELLSRLFPWIAPRVRTIWNGVDLERFAPASEVTGEHSDDLLAVSSVRVWKNARVLARALVVLNERGARVPRVRWAGKVESRDEQALVDDVLARAGLADRWEWLGEHPDVPALLRSHAALIHTSLVEGLPNAVCEALASGLPVLAGSVGDQPRLVQDAVSGFLFDPASPASVADAIERFYVLSPVEKCTMRKAARQFAMEELSLHRVCEEYEAVLRPLVHSEQSE